jgi:hypothetical protein
MSGEEVDNDGKGHVTDREPELPTNILSIKAVDVFQQSV